MELLVYKASAGSGKTFTLAAEYIKHLIINPRAYRQILAVTFTNKATAEMKDRILQQLDGLWKGRPSSDAYLHAIREKLQDTDYAHLSDDNIRRRAGQALQYMLHDYSRFRVETIDSFFQSVMRNLARELELTPNLNIELDTARVLDDAVDSLIEKLTPDSPVLAWLLDYIEERINDEIACGDIIVATDGWKTGVVNGLAVMDRGLASFGTPAVISATVAPGSEGIVNIEHEAGLSGEIHDKGILILEGYLRKAYARSFPLSMYAGICFEQNYSEIDGDSASSSELYALLSAVGEIPVRQDIAVTGSVSQMGQLQPVGGINEKITGFYRTCLRCGLTGRQGVIIPRQNIRSLILPYEVEEAVRDGRFHIYAVSSIEEGMEIMTGLPAGSRNARGVFTPGSFNRMIEDRLKKLYESGKQG